MSLSSKQALEMVKNPPNQQQVKKGREYQSELRILTKPYDGKSIQEEQAWKDTKNYLKNVLTSDKYEAIMKFFTFPLEIVNVSNDILTDLYKVFQGRNSSFDVQYPNERFKEIGQAALNELNVRHWIEEKGKEVLKSEPNSVVVVDIDEEGKAVLVLVSNEKLLGYEQTEKGDFKSVIFLHSVGVDSIGDYKRIALYDDEKYRVYFVRKGVYTLEIEELHGLGYCPAKFFYDNPLLNEHLFSRSVPLSNTRGVMLQWELFQKFLYYADHYGAFPAMEFADTACDEEGCEGGTIKGSAILEGEDNRVVGYTEDKECGTCASKTFIGPGTAVGVFVGQDKDDQDTRGVLKFVTPDTKSLEYVSERQNARENFIKVNTVGFNNVVTKEAVNEQQVRALQESKLKPLFDIKIHLEELYKWIVKTSIKLIYEVDVKVSANYGTEFFVLSENDILLLIQEARKAGVQATELAELNYLLAHTKYKNDPHKAQYMRITADLEPSAFDTREEVEKKFEARMMSREDFYLHLNFTDLINQFERENGSLVLFGSELTYDKKIERIRTTLDFYIKQKLPDEVDDTEQVQASSKGDTAGA